jgi:hypothetical protein
MTDVRSPGPEGPEEDQVESGGPLPKDPEALDRQRMIGARLGELWEVDEGIPDEFLDLLNKLDDKSDNVDG